MNEKTNTKQDLFSKWFWEWVPVEDPANEDTFDFMVGAMAGWNRALQNAALLTKDPNDRKQIENLRALPTCPDCGEEIL
ncbi:MAG: hypothetical protein QF599_00390 [Planctomycetota bacterium]|nr:hypothetical protein [Planctomycetota bacterium]